MKDVEAADVAVETTIVAVASEEASAVDVVVYGSSL